VVVINDRGPFVKRRLIDVSHAAAQRLGFLNHGLAKVRVDVLAEPTS
jgi:rare lipoprotein A